MVDIFSHGRMPILAVSRLHVIDARSIEHNSACYQSVHPFVTFTSPTKMAEHSVKYISSLGSPDNQVFLAPCTLKTPTGFISTGAPMVIDSNRLRLCDPSNGDSANE